jgi:hypothetical protein
MAGVGAIADAGKEGRLFRNRGEKGEYVLP